MNKALFQAPQSYFNPSFWEKLYDLKLNVLKLESAEQHVWASHNCSDGKHHQAIEFTVESHNTDILKYGTNGVLVNVNTVEVT